VIKEMSKKTFENNLINAIKELQQVKKLESKNQKFIIQPVEERNKKLNSKDDYMRLAVLTEKNIGGKLFEIDEVIHLLGFLIPSLPIWINISFVEIIDDDTAVFQLDCSMRIRKPSELKNTEKGYPPFEVVI
jgi:hypothetical protein